jgi:hypothetical protein
VLLFSYSNFPTLPLASVATLKSLSTIFYFIVLSFFGNATSSVWRAQLRRWPGHRNWRLFPKILTSGKPCGLLYILPVACRLAPRGVSQLSSRNSLTYSILLSLRFRHLAASHILWAIGPDYILIYYRPLASRHSLMAPVSHPYAPSYT